MAFIFRESRIGKGAFATAPIARDATIKILTGELLAAEEVFRCLRLGEIRTHDPLQVTEDLYLRLDEESLYFNHSCDPNAAVRGRNRLVAIRDIEAGEEIVFDYSTVIGLAPLNTLWHMDCRCNARNCRGRISSVLSLPPDRLEHYARLGALPDFILGQLMKPGNPLPGNSAGAQPHRLGGR